MPNISAFQAWLSQNLAARNWSYADLARESGMTRQAVGYYMSSKSKYPSIEGIIAVCKAFKVPVSEALVVLGLLPRGKTGPSDEVLELYDQLDPEDQREALAFLRYRMEMREQGNRRKRAAKLRPAK